MPSDEVVPRGVAPSSRDIRCAAAPNEGAPPAPPTPGQRAANARPPGPRLGAVAPGYGLQRHGRANAAKVRPACRQTARSSPVGS